LSVIGRTSIPGCIAVEAIDRDDVYQLCHGIHDIYSNDISPIDREQNLNYLTEGPSYEPTEGSWVRLCRYPYQGDLAIVASVDSRSLTITVRCKPRIDLNPDSVKGKGNRKRKRGDRPAQVLFDPSAVAKVYGSDSVSPRNQVYVFKNKIFREGWMDMDVKTGNFVPATPTRQELMSFRECSTIPEEYITRQLKVLNSINFRPGQSVKILRRDLAGSIGKVQSHRGDEVDVSLDEMSVPVTLPISAIRQNFRTGDDIKVVFGHNIGCTGIVLSADGDLVNMWDIDHATEVCDLLSPLVYPKLIPFFPASIALRLPRLSQTRPFSCRRSADANKHYNRSSEGLLSIFDWAPCASHRTPPCQGEVWNHQDIHRS
jgi:hypothetical protein